MGRPQNPTPYLFIPDGRCAEAMRFYADLFGGALSILHVKDGPMAERMPDAGDLVMHSELTLPGGALMASDNLMDRSAALSGFAVMVEIEGLAAARSAFDRLAEGGTVRMAFGPTHWQKGFGMVVDRFGVGWMISTAENAG